MTFLLFLAVVSLPLLAWASVFFIIPGTLRDFYTYSLWRLRDQLVDEIIADGYDDKAAAVKVLSYVRVMIDSANDVSPARIWLLRGLSRSLKPALPDLTHLSDGDRLRLQAHLDELARLSTRHARRGTPSGWLLGYLLGFQVSLRDTALLLEMARYSDAHA